MSAQSYLIGAMGTTVVLFTGLMAWDGFDVSFAFNRLLHATGAVVAVVVLAFGYFVRKGSDLAIANRPMFRPEDGCATTWK
ncbi:hypothetical protein DYB36_002122 [Aphanomyces astaci]|uniref:Uncharacterized protein n=1 Tax=Aphanomyces astaci TaxID=112090 RepID=A0A397BRD5_APHAT|nr:hypothetical protein DYB36_002122 [Aphanomyces astaci]